ncbi:hypothetical protein WLF18_01155 [Pseudomonas shirazensis]|uniref:HNH endonuclease n=1 Tax=Pseudomonas shirazensis TaxID=2745494 RepID=A0ABU8ZTR9_9PSED
MSNEFQEDRLPGEEWADMPGLAGLCEVSSLGRARTVPRQKAKKDNQGRITTARYDSRYLTVEKVTGRFYVTPRVDGKLKKIRLPEAIIEAFRGESADGRKVAYLNGNNEDHRLENLSWLEKKESGKREITDQQIEIISRCSLSDEDLAILMDVSSEELRLARLKSQQKAKEAEPCA